MLVRCGLTQDMPSDVQIVSLNGTKAGHGINISDSAEDGVVVGSVDYGSPAHQSDKIAKGMLRPQTHAVRKFVAN